MQPPSFSGPLRPVSHTSQEESALQHTFSQLLQFFTLQQILAFKTSLLPFNEHEITIKHQEYQELLQNCGSSNSTGFHSSYQVVNTPSSYVDRNSFASRSSRSSGTSFRSSTSNSSRLSSNVLNPSPQTLSSAYYPNAQNSGNETYYPVQSMGTVIEELFNGAAVENVEAFPQGAHSPTIDSGCVITQIQSPMAPTTQEQKDTTGTLPQSQIRLSSIEDNRKIVPCPSRSCPKMFADPKILLAHCESSHDHDVQFVCPHCRNPYYSQKAANRHHKTHPGCPKGTNCIEGEVKRIRKYWGCGVCGSAIFNCGADWADHHCDHFLDKSNVIAATSTSQPKPRMTLTFTILSLVKQPAVDLIWKKRNQELDWPAYDWDDDKHFQTDILHGLQYGTYGDKSLKNHEVAVQLIDDLVKYRRRIPRSVQGRDLSAHKRQASTSPRALQMGFAQQTSSEPHPINDTGAARERAPLNLLDDFPTMVGYVNRPET